jgi:type I restriction enzyme S subunit
MADAVQIENVGVNPEAGALYRYVGLEHIEQQTGAILDCPETDGAEIRSLKYRFEPHHVLYGKLRPNLNKVALPEFDGIFSTDILPLAVRTPAVREYLAYYLRSPGFVHLATRRASGTKMPRFGPTQLVKAPVPLPPILVQRRVVEILSRAEEVRRKRAEAATIVDALLLSTFVHRFGDPLANPHGYPLVPLGQLGEVVSGVTKGRKLDPAQTVEVPYLRVANVQDGFLDLSEVKMIGVLPADVGRYRLEDGDILMIEGCGNPAYLGRGCIWRGEISDCIHQNHVFRVRIDRSRALPEYIATILQTQYANAYFRRCAKNSSGLANINSTQVKAFGVPLPPIAEQQEFAVAEEKRRDALARSVQLQTGSAAALACLSQHAFSGELTAEWEKENSEEIAAYQRIHDELPRLVLVGLLGAARREAAKRNVMLTALMKYAFLFQMRNRARQRLYAFRPYKYGPFASEVYDHLGVLEADGLIRQREGSSGGEREWHAIELTAKGRAYADELLPAFDPELVDEIADVAREYGPLDHDALLDRVYEEYPRFARKSVRGRGASKGASSKKSKKRRRR